MTNEALLNIINHCIGVIGYFDSKATKVETDGDRTIVHWRGESLIFDKEGYAISEDGLRL